MKDNTTTKASFSYSNNLDGSISGLSETDGALSETCGFEYGVLGGLTKDTRINSYAYGNNYSYTGDNLTQITNGNAVTNLSYNWNQLTSASSTTGGQNFSASYDDPATAPGYGSGSATTFNDGTTTWHYGYDVDGNLISVSAGSTVVYTATYDGLGRICKENDNGAITYWLYDAGGNQSLALDGSGNLNSQYIWGPTGILASYYNPVTAVPEDGFSMGSSMSSSASSENTFEAIIEKRFYFDDGRGNVRLLTDESINQTARYAYDSWGNDLDANIHSGVSQPFTWNGGNGYTHNDTTNLYHAGARSYNSRMKQWLQRDPIDFDSGDANLYGYCGFDGVNSVDPYGLSRDGNMWQYIFSSDYGCDIWKVFKGEGKSIAGIVTGPISLYQYFHQKGISAQSTEDLLADMWSQFWGGLTGTDPEEFGSSFMTLEMIVAPLGKKIPNITPLKIHGPWLNKSGGCTLINMKWKGKNIFRANIQRLPSKGKAARKIPVKHRGKVRPYIHKIPKFKQYWPWGK